MGREYDYAGRGGRVGGDRGRAGMVAWGGAIVRCGRFAQPAQPVPHQIQPKQPKQPFALCGNGINTDNSRD